ncbi:phage major capsid family protein [Nocardia sp. NPDC004711]
MAVLGTSNITLPKNIAKGMWKKASTGSTVAQLSGAEPMQYGDVTVMTFNTLPRAEYVGEGADKASSTVGFGTKTVTPKKVQVTLRFNQEVQWADEDYQLGVLQTCADAMSESLSRALDLGVYHAINPLTGLPISGLTENLTDTTNAVEILDGTGANLRKGPELEIEAAAGLVIADGFTPNGIAFDPTYAWEIATERYADGRKKFPDVGFGANITNFGGLSASTSSTVSGVPEASTATNIKAIVGDFKTIRWGVQRNVGIEKITYGDPDGQGDLKRKNQIALRGEVVYGWAFMDLNAFAVIKNAVDET